MKAFVKPSTVRECFTPDINDAQRLRLLNIFCGDRVAAFVEENARRAEFRDRALAIADERGRVALFVWSRDCDMTEGYSRREVSAADALEQRDRMMDDREGPMSISLHRTSEPFEGYSRDLAMEASEDGHPHVIHA